MKGYKFIDSAKAYVSGGNGGNGCVGFRREKFVPKGGPDGGDGGRGGHVIFKAVKDEDSLIKIYYHPHLRAENGGYGKGKKQHGRNGKDLLVTVPRGTEIRDAETKESLYDLVDENSEWIAARGGKGGLGNCHWLTSTHRAPREHTDGEPGESRTLRLELKLIADVGLVGLPNAGKSSLLKAMTPAHPKVAAYPFTTLSPTIGILKESMERELRMVDIPGLIKGAHEGSGLGDTFLKHIERTRGLVIILDMAGTEGRNPADDYAILVDELKQYNETLVSRPTLVVANKTDLPEAAAYLKRFKRKTHVDPIPVSALTGDGLDRLKEELFRRFVC